MDRSRSKQDALAGGRRRGDAPDAPDADVSRFADEAQVVRSGVEPSIAPSAPASVGSPSLHEASGAMPLPSSTGQRPREQRSSPQQQRDGSRQEIPAERHAGIEQRTYPQRRVLRAPADAAGQVVSTEEIIDIPVFGEDVETYKRIRVGEEVEIVKEGVQHTEHVAATVRHERVHVEGTDRAEDERGGRRGGRS